MKAFKIENDIVAANSREQALQEWANYFEEKPSDARSVEEVDPDTFMVNFEQDDGSFKPGPLRDAMPVDGEPCVVINGDDF